MPPSFPYSSIIPNMDITKSQNPHLGAEYFSFSAWSNWQKVAHSACARSYRRSKPWLVSQTFYRMIKLMSSSLVFLVIIVTIYVPVHVWRRQSANPLQGKLFSMKTHFCSSLKGRSPTIQLLSWITQYSCVNKMNAIQIFLYWESQQYLTLMNSPYDNWQVVVL